MVTRNGNALLALRRKPELDRKIDLDLDLHLITPSKVSSGMRKRVESQSQGILNK